METGAFSFNPYAASYVPISHRRATSANKDHTLTKITSESGSEAEIQGSQPEDITQMQHQEASFHGTDVLQNARDSTSKVQSVYGFHASSLQNQSEMTEKQIMDEDTEMALAYLQMTFPGLSDESLSEAYLANKGDVETTIDMLNQLELYAAESSEELPDTLDIGDISEHTNEVASQKLKKMAGEAGDSSSSSSVSAPVT